MHQIRFSDSSHSLQVDRQLVGLLITEKNIRVILSSVKLYELKYAASILAYLRLRTLDVICLMQFNHSRSFLRKYHTHVLEFDGTGNWSFRPLEKDAAAITPGLPRLSEVKEDEAKEATIN